MALLGAPVSGRQTPSRQYTFDVRLTGTVGLAGAATAAFPGAAPCASANDMPWRNLSVGGYEIAFELHGKDVDGNEHFAESSIAISAKHVAEPWSFGPTGSPSATGAVTRKSDGSGTITFRNWKNSNNELEAVTISWTCRQAKK